MPRASVYLHTCTVRSYASFLMTRPPHNQPPAYLHTYMPPVGRPEGTWPRVTNPPNDTHRLVTGAPIPKKLVEVGPEQPPYTLRHKSVEVTCSSQK